MEDRSAVAALPTDRGRARHRIRRGDGNLIRLVVPERLPGIADAHAHLQHESFAHDLDAVLDRAREAGLGRILIPGWDRASSEAALELAARYPDLLDAAVGIHPHYVAAATNDDWAAVDLMAAEDGAKAVGEIGLDYYRNLSPPDVQRDALARQLDLAARVDKPVLVHDREAHADVTAVLVTHAVAAHAVSASGDGIADRVAGVLHAFSGDAAMAATLVGAGYLISFALPISFPKNIGPREAAAAVPGRHLLVETDSPYLGLSRDRRNEPTTVLRTASVVARLRNQAAEDISTAVGVNYLRLTARFRVQLP